MKLTRHNGRAGKNGVYNPKHNDRNFNVENSEHIDPVRVSQNVYWDCYQGFFSPKTEEEEKQMGARFEQVERAFYLNRYYDFCEAQNERNRKTGHTERNRDPEDLLKSKKTAPEESIIQIGTMEDHIPSDVLLEITAEFFIEFSRRFGEHVHILDWSLHMDEATPHIHERHVFDCETRYGEIAPQQEKALEALDIPLPFPDKPPGKNNNRKITFDAICRTLLFDIAQKHDVHLEREPEYGGRAYLEKQDYILMRQKEKLSQQSEELSQQSKDILINKMTLLEQEDTLEEQEGKIADRDRMIAEKDEKLENLTLKLNDVETLMDEVVDIEEMSTGISIMDLGLNEFRLDLLDYVKNHKDLETKPFGMHAVVPATDEMPEGVIFVLKNRNNGVNIDSMNRIHPFYMVYISVDGEIICDYLNPKKLMDDLRLLCRGKTEPIKEVYQRFNEETDDGRNMAEMSELLSEAINSIIDVKEESDIDSLFKSGGTSALMSAVTGLDDFELVCFLVVKEAKADA